jgi:peptidoglycan/xylan/chitin deacetylase (PgdA/CDA1 family)
MISSLLPLQRMFFRDILWRTNSNAIHLTFDDGPHPVATPELLELLRMKNVKATFFLLGKNVVKYPEIVRQIQRDGHLIGNHSFSHANLFFKSRNDIEYEIRCTDEEIQKITGEKPRLFRPPYGYLSRATVKVAKKNSLRVTLWSVDVRDFRNPSLSTITRRIIMGLAPGSIILMHDNGLTQTRIVETISHLIDNIHARGHTLSTLPSK